MFDNSWTVPYSCLVSVWAIIFLELWKRLQARSLRVHPKFIWGHSMIYTLVNDLEQYRLTFKWNCSEFDTPDDYVRPAYIEKSNGTLKYRPSKLRYEVHIPAYERRKGFGFSCITILFFLSLVIMAVFSCMFFQLWLSGMYNITSMITSWAYI